MEISEERTDVEPGRLLEGARRPCRLEGREIDLDQLLIEPKVAGAEDRLLRAEVVTQCVQRWLRLRRSAAPPPLLPTGVRPDGRGFTPRSPARARTARTASRRGCWALPPSGRAPSKTASPPRVWMRFTSNPCCAWHWGPISGSASATTRDPKQAVGAVDMLRDRARVGA